MADADPPREHSPVRSSGVSNGRMTLLFTVMLVTAAGNTAMQSVMPSIATALEVEDYWMSLAFSWSALLWVVCAPIWARRSDRRGRKAMMGLGLFGFVISMIGCGLVLWAGLVGWIGGIATLIFFAAARSLYGGFGSAAPPAVQAYVASRTPRSQRTNALSLIASSFGLGTVIGPALAPLMVVSFLGLGLTGPFIGFALLGIIVFVLLRLRLPDDQPQFAARGVAASYSEATNAASGIDGDEDEGDAEPDRLKWTDSRIRPWIVAQLLGGHAQAMVLGVTGFLVLDRLGLRETPAEGAGPVGLVLMAGAIASLFAQWGVIPRFNLGPRAATLGGLLVAGLGSALLGMGTNLHVIALGYAIASLGFGLFRPGTTAGTSLAVTRAEQGQASGVVASLAGASYIYAPALGVWLYGQSDWLGFGLIVALCLAAFAHGWATMQPDTDMTRERS
ncbi:MAG: MFS transporter [Erythrobacter sp.]